MIQFQNRQIKLPDGSPVIVCRLIGSIDGSTVYQFEEKLLGFLEQGTKHLIVVFSQVKYINSTGMGVLVKLADKFQEVGGDINLIDVPDKLIALFNMLGLLALIKISKTEEEAIQAFQKNIQQVSITEKCKDIPQKTNPQENKQPKAKPKPQKKLENTMKRNIDEYKNAKTNTAPVKNTEVKKVVVRRIKNAIVVTCQGCNCNISLGTKPRAGTYKCPKCAKLFKLLPTGQIYFFKKKK